MTPYFNASYLVKKDSDNARAICKQTHTLNEVCHLFGILVKPHACQLLHAHMKENTTHHGSHNDAV